MSTENADRNEDASAPAPAPAKPSGRVTKDPFAKQNAYRIDRRLPGDEEFPEGYQLSWINPQLRNGSMGWQGWRPVEYGDRWAGQNGENLAGFLADVPMRAFGPDRVDNYVRRGDLVLCYLPAVWYDDRKSRSANESQARVDGLAVPEGQQILPNVVTVGGGLQNDPNPNFGTGTPEDAKLGKLGRSRR